LHFPEIEDTLSVTFVRMLIVLQCFDIIERKCKDPSASLVTFLIS